jgi:hypothetical protein
MCAAESVAGLRLPATEAFRPEPALMRADHLAALDAPGEVGRPGRFRHFFRIMRDNTIGEGHVRRSSAAEEDRESQVQAGLDFLHIGNVGESLLGRTGEPLACPECENRFREYLIFRSAVARFANYLDDMENERRRILEESRPEGAPPLVKVKARLRVKHPTVSTSEEAGTLTPTG